VRPILLGIAVMLVAASCGGQAVATATISRYVPDLAGVVTARDATGDSWTLTVADGSRAVVPAEEFMNGTSSVGDLLLVGSTPHRWARTVTHAPAGSGWPPDCFPEGSPAWVRGATVEVQINAEGGQPAILVVPKANSFDAQPRADGSLPTPGHLCLDGSGKAIAYLSSGR
jgi:hypothetical protein